MSFGKFLKSLTASVSYSEPKQSDAYAWRVMDENRRKIHAEPVTNEEFKAALKAVTDEISALRKRAKAVERKSIKDEAKWHFNVEAYQVALDILNACDTLHERAEIVCDQYMMGRGKVDLGDKHGVLIDKIGDVEGIADEARILYEGYRDDENPFD